MSTALPIAQLPAGGDSAPFYDSFSAKIDATWTLGGGLVVRLASDDPVSRLHAPLRAFVRIVRTGQSLTAGAPPVSEDTLLLKTWPAEYLKLGSSFDGPVPALIAFGNIDATAVGAAAPDVITASGVEVNAGSISNLIDEYVAGEANLLARSGILLGHAGPDSSSSSLPRRVTIRMFDQAGSELHPVYYLMKFAELAGVDPAVHPLLRLLNVAGANDPLLLSQLVQIENPTGPGAYDPADCGIFATLAPRLRIAVDDAAAADALEVAIENPLGQITRITDSFAYEPAVGAVFSSPSVAAATAGVHVLSVSGALTASVRFMLYDRDDPVVPIDFVDDTYVPTHVPSITRSDRLIGVQFVDGTTDADMSSVLRKHGLYPMSLSRPWRYVTTLNPPGVRIFDKVGVVTAESQVEIAFVPGNRAVSSRVRKRGDKPVMILREDFSYEEPAPVG